MSRKVSHDGLELIAGFEGFVDHAYKPVAAETFWTIGYGHYGPDVKPGARVTRARALELLRVDARSAEETVNRLVHVQLTQGQFDALVSLVYNIGAGNFASSTVLRQLNRRRPRLAAAAFGMWVRGASGRLPGLVSRRAREARLFLKHTPKGRPRHKQPRA